MKTTRLEAFSDGVIAILITIMVLELRTPAGHDWADLASIGHHFWPYVLSFVMLGIYWNNHHHMIHMTERVTGAILWANLHLLFWLSLIPFGTAWVGDSERAPVPVATYGAILMLAGTAYYILKTAIIRSQGPHSRLHVRAREQHAERHRPRGQHQRGRGAARAPRDGTKERHEKNCLMT